MNKVAGWLAGVLAVSVAVAVHGAPVESARRWALQDGAEGAVKRLAGVGITNATDQAAIQADWEEDVIVTAALRAKAYRFLIDQVRLKSLTVANRQRVKESLVEEDPAPSYTLGVVQAFPASERGDFRRVLEAHYRDRFAAQPVLMGLYLKHALEKDFSFGDPALTISELVMLLLAPESMVLRDNERAKQAIKDRAVKLARMKLRQEGKSFVICDGINPLVERVAPVVSALNAPACAGLEAALRGLGEEVADGERDAMLGLVAGWREQMLRGEIGGNELTPLLGKIAVALGPEGYNAFVDEYNNGKAP